MLGSTALNFINVARKAVYIPLLKEEIASGNLGVAKARKIVPVLTVENQAEWIERAKTLSSRELEKAVARVAPRDEQPESIRYLSEVRLRVSLNLDEKVFEAIKRVQDLESQRQARAVSLEDTLAAMSACYLQKNDPLEKAKRARTREKDKESDVTGQAKKARALGKRIPLPAAVLHLIQLRDEGRCTHRDTMGLRCDQRRWLQIHHVRPVSQCGSNDLANLTTLCSAHHKTAHLRSA